MEWYAYSWFRSTLGYAGSIWQRALDICGVLVGLECGCVCCSAQQRVCDISSSADMGMVVGGGIPDENAVRCPMKRVHGVARYSFSLVPGLRVGLSSSTFKSTFKAVVDEQTSFN